MAMTKKEKEMFEAALTEAALRSTCDVYPDVFPPESFGDLSTGFAVVAANSDYARVEIACSSSIAHGIGKIDKTSSQRSINLFSQKILALKALRREVEKQCAKKLRRIDKMIAEECEESK